MGMMWKGMEEGLYEVCFIVWCGVVWRGVFLSFFRGGKRDICPCLNRDIWKGS
jgi:hypothetical protein